MNLIVTTLYMGLIFILSVIESPVNMERFTGFDKVVHFFIYCLMGLLWARVFVSKGCRGSGCRQGHIVLKALAVSFFYGLFIEIVQGFLPAREASLFDALANGAGAVAGASLYCFVHKSFRLS